MHGANILWLPHMSNGRLDGSLTVGVIGENMEARLTERTCRLDIGLCEPDGCVECEGADGAAMPDLLDDVVCGGEGWICEPGGR